MVNDRDEVARIAQLILAEPVPSRAATLDRECGDDVELRQQVEALLAQSAATQASDLNPASGTEETCITPADEPSGSRNDPVAVTGEQKSGEDSLTSGALRSTHVWHPQAAPSGIIADRYTLQRKIGEGGMGEVWIARQSEPVKRHVALKLIKAGMDSRAVLARFEQERQALALMDHPNIARVYDAGTTPTGQPFFAMELIDGLPLTKFCDSARLSPAARLELFVPICQAVQHAHQKGIVHRDLKPANILVTVVDGKPVPKVIDFGVAKATGGKLTEQTLSTGFGAVVGTLEYMAPEQAGTTGDDVDTRADIYSLGVVLYEVLTGLRPFDGATLRRAALSEMIRIIREDDPARPSTRLSADASLPSLAAMRQTEPRKLMAELRGELDWVIMKCLEKSRDRRYETASGLARDIQRYLANETVEARPPSAGYRVQKFVTRHKSTVVAVGLVLLSLLGGIIGTTLGLFEAKRQTQIAVTKAADAELARRGEEEQKQAALQANQQAFEALQSFTSDLMGNLLGSRSELTDTERAVLENAQKQWDVFALSRGTSPEARVIRAEGAANLALIQHKLGLHREAEANDRKALSIRESLAEEFPDDASYRKRRGMSHQNLGASLRASGQRSEAGKHFAAATRIFESLAADFPAEPDYRVRLSESCISHGNFERDYGNWDAARSRYLQALDLQEQLLAESPASKHYQESVARSHWGLAFLHKRQDLTAESTGHYQKAIAIYDALVAATPEATASLEYRLSAGNLRREFGVMLSDSGDDQRGAEQLSRGLPILQAIAEQFPAVPRYQADLAKAQRDYAQVLGYLEELSKARTEFDLAIAAQQRLVDEHPTVLPYQAELGITLRMMGDLEFRAVQPTVALKRFDDAVRILTSAHVQDRDYVTVRNSLCRSHEHRALALDHLQRHREALLDWSQVLELSRDEDRDIHRAQQADSRLRSGDVEEAIAEVAELEQIENDNPNHWFRFAKLYAIAAEKLSSREAEFVEHAMRLLTKSVDLGFSDLERLRDDEELAKLRDRDDFRTLLNRLETSRAR